MRGLMVAAVLAGLVGLSGGAEAKGCIKGAIVGGVAGHFAGHHAILGALAGCAVGRHMANRPPAAVVPATPPAVIPPK
jgi:hypothetical protein